MTKKISRMRRAKKTRLHIAKLNAMRLTVYKSTKHIYAQVTTADGSKTLVSASTLDKDLRSKINISGNINAATEVGTLIASRAVKAGIEKVAFDRSGYIYHGRIKALAEAAREAGLQF